MMNDLGTALLQVHSILRRMFELADGQLADTVNALVTGDAEQARNIMERDRKIDVLELENGRQCFDMLNSLDVRDALLYAVLAALRISSHLERVGDLCRNVCKAVCVVHPIPRWQSETGILDMADAARQMLRVSADAYASQNRLQARQVMAQDRQIDRTYRGDFAAMNRLVSTGGAPVEAVLHLVTVSRSMERIGDHVKSIARGVVYAIEGVDIRYSAAQDRAAT